MLPVIRIIFSAVCVTTLVPLQSIISDPDNLSWKPLSIPTLNYYVESLVPASSWENTKQIVPPRSPHHTPHEYLWIQEDPLLDIKYRKEGHPEPPHQNKADLKSSLVNSRPFFMGSIQVNSDRSWQQDSIYSHYHKGIRRHCSKV